uniref:Gamma-glutamylcyclotransferase AIG2-like domain-containing protein n=1 Tax=Calcidiscus leptoporus TaxID=127549 RepID=A0A7S0IWQ4_9EUKA|mmetsp:Transcript_2703/g.6109  ORF Transcript_2703/g.6109 Transcript_2703/m.6109 type:complete len:220 (+) Transcript_2703:181-840(+)
MPSGSITILGLGSLLSERSSRTTFPDLENFRLVIVKGYRRTFAHTPSIFHERGIANRDTLEMASLSAEPCTTGSFVCTAFEVFDQGMDAFREREEEFELRMVPYLDLDGAQGGLGMLCVCSTDEAYIEAWGSARFERLYLQQGLTTIWRWPIDSMLRPCAAYLRHCALAAEKMGPHCQTSFLDDTYLVDRVTTVRAYLEKFPEVLSTLPPPSLCERYGG